MVDNIAPLAARIVDAAKDSKRFIVGIAGAPGAGKSTLVEPLAKALDDAMGAGATIIVPMDGFHLDNVVLHDHGLFHRKGAPETFDAAGYIAILRRIASMDGDVAVPTFDRVLDLSRAGARIVTPAHRIVLTEGNYLLLDEAPWRDLTPLLDMTVSLRVDADRLEERLVRRWLEHGLTREAAIRRAQDNDMANAHRVMQDSRPADIVWPG